MSRLRIAWPFLAVVGTPVFFLAFLLNLDRVAIAAGAVLVVSMAAVTVIDIRDQDRQSREETHE